MRISTETASICRHVSHEKAIELCARAGFDCFDITMTGMVGYDWANKVAAPSDSVWAKPDCVQYARLLKKVGEDNGITCNQTHAAYPVSCPEIRDSLKCAIECTAEAGGKICVIHPDNDKNGYENAEMYIELLPFAKEHGVKLATENMWNWNYELDQAAPAACSDPKSFLEHIIAVNDPYLIACLDIGHAEMQGLNTNAVDMIHALGDSLQALHIHDIDKHDDNHQIPFSLNVEFEPIVKALKAIGYKGDFTLEACTYLNAFNADNVFEGVKDLAKAARKLADWFDDPNF